MFTVKSCVIALSSSSWSDASLNNFIRGNYREREMRNWIELSRLINHSQLQTRLNFMEQKKNDLFCFFAKPEIIQKERLFNISAAARRDLNVEDYP